MPASLASGSVFGLEDLIPPLWFHPLHDLSTSLTVSLSFGAGLISVGLLLTVINSLRYQGLTLNDSIELGLQASNLLNTKTVLLQQITDKNSPEGKNILVPNAWFQNDRKLIVSVRWKMGKY